MTTTRQGTSRRRSPTPARGRTGSAKRGSRRPPSRRSRARARPSRRQVLRRRGMAVLSLLTVAGLGYVLLFTPVVGVRAVDVVGERDVPARVIREAANVPERQPMVRVDTDAVAERVAALPGVAQVAVSRSWPSTLEITVTERTPVGFYDTGKALYLVDSGGVVYKRVPDRPKGIPKLDLPKVGPEDPASRAVTRVLSVMTDDLRTRITVARADTPGGIEFTLADDTIVRWGSAQQSERKSAVLAVLLTREGAVYDVSSPELPTVSNGSERKGPQ